MKKIIVTVMLVIATCIVVLSSNVKVNWTHGGESNTVSGYNIYYGSSSKNYTNVTKTGYVTNTVISNLSSNSTFYFSGTTLGFNNLETDFGNEVKIITVSKTNTLPGAVKDFVITKVVRTIY